MGVAQEILEHILIKRCLIMLKTLLAKLQIEIYHPTVFMIIDNIQGEMGRRIHAMEA